MHSHDPEGALRALYDALLSSWNDRDASRFGALFDSQGYAVGFDGSQMNGAREIASALEPIFRDHPTASYVGKVQRVDTLGEGVALVRAIASMVPPGGSELMPDRNAIQTLVARKGEEGWRIVLWQNTPARFDGRPQLVEQMTAELREVQHIS